MQATVRETADWVGALEIASEAAGDGERVLAGVSTDTRSIRPGQLFVPLRGERFDGHDYIVAAREAGAAAALWDASVPRPEGLDIPLIFVTDTLEALQRLSAAYLSERLAAAKVVAITGSNGKTTTKDLIASVLAASFLVHKTEGNYNNHIGLPLTILSAPEDTQALVLEMGMSGFGEISLLTRLARPDIAVITNIGESHLLQLGSRRGIAQAKLEIAEGLKPGGALVYCGDEPLLAEALTERPLTEGTKQITFGENAGNDWVARYVRVTAEGTRFTATGELEAAFELPVPGRHNAVNALAAVAVGRLLGLSAETIGEGLKRTRLTGMRIERSAAWNGAILLNDAYNASPTSVRAAINLVAELSGFRRKWVVLGDMLELGDGELELHGDIGRYLDRSKADRVLLHGPRSKRIYEEARTKFEDQDVLYFDDKKTLGEHLLAELSPDDLVLVKASRGMKMEEIVSTLQRGGGQ